MKLAKVSFHLVVESRSEAPLPKSTSGRVHMFIDSFNYVNLQEHSCETETTTDDNFLLEQTVHTLIVVLTTRCVLASARNAVRI